MLRRGIRAVNVLSPEWLWNGELSGKILCEGAQSVWLDIDHGDYPYVTSSTTMPYAACSLGFSPKKINRIIGIAKIYDTKSGIDPLFPESLWNDPVLNKIIELGGEYGSTTGRKRLVNWLNLDKLISSVRISGCTELIINKCDVLEKIGVFKVIHGTIVEFTNFGDMKKYILNTLLLAHGVDLHDIIFSGDVETI
jgi:adenylosuccinate synthase